MEEIWTIHNKRFDYHAAAQELGVNPVLIKVMRNRGLETVEEMKQYLGISPFAGYDGSLMKDLVNAAKLIHEAFLKGCHLRIVGDYDVDGIMSTYTLYTGLQRIIQKFPANNTITYEIPDRIEDGYGVNERIIENAKNDGVDVILTCDNGIAAVKALSLAKQYNMTVIITDHHGIPKTGLPPADAIVNPHQEDCNYPFSELCGAAVAFKLVSFLFQQYGLSAYIEGYAPYVALATVCDVMPLMDENRYLVQYGLNVLRTQMQNRCVDTGLNALLDANNVTAESLDSYTFGFIIGPCLNASGRLATAKKGLRLLMETNVEKAAHLADALTVLNNVRKNLSKKFEEIAYAQAAIMEDWKVIVILLHDCHESIAGIIAGRVREATGKPTFIMTTSQREPEVAKGSGRSIPEYHMFNKMNEVKDLFLKFGGHPGAAGFSLKLENVGKLREELNARCELSDHDIAIKRKIDLMLPSEYVSVDLLNELQRLKPFGNANEKPVFAMSNTRIVGLKIVGQNQNVLQLQIMTETGQRIKGVYFNSNPLGIFKPLEEESGLNVKSIMESGKPFSIPAGITYFPKENEWNGNVYIDYQITGIKYKKES